ncbi:hypothetical protein [Candidatus Nanohalobium constans]|uniref:Uncharacterized protein n=1 Tax=Candidatus Nanohalobium constans TaxID=2565781 RepID=A0A5Q0UGR3_9ARCH|nr:hypothetical protein [Candidatus Nanohalobium constans]QGA80766.1 hypothetical protein LC1Nh_0883 [Candidatus Nanohalobium constans]
MPAQEYSGNSENELKSESSIPEDWIKLQSDSGSAYVMMEDPITHHSKLDIVRNNDGNWVTVYEPMSAKNKDQPNKYDLPNNIFDSRESAEEYAEKILNHGLGNIFAEYGIRTARNREHSRNRKNTWTEEFGIQITELD